MASSSDATQRAAQQAAQDLAAGLRVHVDASLPELRVQLGDALANAEEADVIFLRADALGSAGALAQAPEQTGKTWTGVALELPKVAPDAVGPKVNRWITPLAVLDPHGETLRVREVAPGTSATDVQALLGSALVVGPDLAPMNAPT